MKKIAFVTRRKILAQGLDAVLKTRPALEMELFPMIPYQNAGVDLSVYQPDIVIVDVNGELDREGIFSLCGEARQNAPGCRVLLLLSEETEQNQSLSVCARQSGQADDFVFCENSMNYLLAKLAAL